MIRALAVAAAFLVSTLPGPASGATAVARIPPALAMAPEGAAASSARIAFVGQASDGTSRIYVMDSDGTNARALTAGPHDTAPRWSPDGKKIAFGGQAPGGTDIRIFTINSDDTTGASLTQVTNGPEDLFPAWSPDGSRIAYLKYLGPPDQSDPANPASLDIVNADGTNNVATGARAGGPGATVAWSPDGKRLSFERIEGGRNQIATVNIDGSGLSILPTTGCQPWGAAWPDWSPDGSEIAFYCETQANGPAWIATEPPTGGPIVKIADATLTHPTGVGTYLAWSPDGMQLAVAGGPTSGIIVMNADGSGQVNIGSGGVAHAYYPAWGRTACSGLIGRVMNGHGDDFPSIRVQLYDGPNPVGSFVATDRQGKYCIPATSATIDDDNFRVRATLADGDHDPSLFETFKDGVDGPVFTDRSVSAADVGRTDLNIDFAATSDKPYLPDVAAIDYQSNRFIGWLLDKVGIPPAAFVPVKIVTFAPETNAGGGTRYSPSSDTAYIATSESGYDKRATGTDECPENCEWHELAHHLARMWHIAPVGETPACDNRVAAHAGWANPTTCDSLQEGFATWLPTLASLDIDAGRGPDYATPDYSVFGSLEDNAYQPWDVETIDGEVVGREDLAVAQLLWDLADDTPAEALHVTTWDSQNALCFGASTAMDSIAIGGIALLQFMGKTPPQTVADLYGSLKASGLVSRGELATTTDVTGDGKPDVSAYDAAFLAHGFNTVPDMNDPCFRFGSPVARTDHVPDTTGGLVPRPDEPLLPGSAIDFVNTGATDATFALDVTYPSTTSHFDIEVPANSSRLVHFEAPPYWSAALPPTASMPPCGAPGPTTVTLQLSGAGVPPRTIDSCEYLHDVAQATNGAAITFGGPAPAQNAPANSSSSQAPFPIAVVALLALLGLGVFVIGARRVRRR